MCNPLIIMWCADGMAGRELASALSLESYEKDLKEAAILDYYVAGYWYCNIT